MLTTFRQKVLDILKNGEHYVSTLAEKFRYSASLRTTPRNPFRGVGYRHLGDIDLGRELLHGIR